MIDPNGRGPRMLGMMGVVLGFALGFGAIKSPTSFGGQAVVVATVATLIVATLGAILSTPKAFWFGLASVGWASLLLSAEFWIDDLGGPYLLGAAIHNRLDPAGFQDSIHRFEFGLSQYRKIVFCQIALAQGLLGGLLSVLLVKWGRRTSIGQRLGGRRPAILAAALSLMATILALRFHATLFAIVYVQLVTTALFAATLGGFVGRRRRECLSMAVVGWAALVLAAKGTETSPLGAGDASAGWIEAFYSRIYPQAFDPRPDEEADSSSWAALRSWLVGEPFPGAAQQIGWRWRPPPSTWAWERAVALGRFSRVVQHAEALAAMMIGAAAWAAWLERRRPGREAP